VAATVPVMSSSVHLFTSSRPGRSGRESPGRRPAPGAAPRPSGRAGAALVRQLVGALGGAGELGAPLRADETLGLESAQER